VRVGAATTTGGYRESNEDRYYVGSEEGLFIVADGMGGQLAGEKASQMTVEVVPREVGAALEAGQFNGEPLDGDEAVCAMIRQAVVTASGEVWDLGQEDSDFRDMGSTITLALARPDKPEKLFVLGLGDSRAYRFRGDGVEQLTVDHTMAQALADAGTIEPHEVETHQFRNVLWQFIGVQELSDGLEVKIVDVEAGDRFLLASDGLTGVLSDEQVGHIVGKWDDPNDCCRRLVDAALVADSKDNITCLAIFF